MCEAQSRCLVCVVSGYFFMELMLGKEYLDFVDECDQSLFNAGSQGVWVAKVKIPGQVALKDGINACCGCNDTVLGPIVVLKNLPILSLCFAVACGKPSFEPESLIVEDDGYL